MDFLIFNADIITSGGIIKRGSVFVRDGKIMWAGKRPPSKFMNSRAIDGGGCFASPGFIDLQIYGNPKKVAGREVASGTTGFLATVPCSAQKATLKKIDSIVRDIKTQRDGAKILGINLEGPYLNSKKAGAQDKKSIRRPDSGELRSFIKKARGHLRMMTIAPETDGALDAIKILASKGVVPSIGHTRATFEQAERAADAGANCTTHVFNAMEKSGRHGHRGIEAVLDDARISATVILDGEHINPSAFRMLLKRKGRDRVVLITDSLRSDASFKAKWDGSVYRLKDGTVAGSGLTMIDAVRNAVRSGGLPLKEAVALASANPARLLGLERKGGIKKGNDADIVLFDRNYDVWMTMVEGRIAYKRCAV